MHVLFVKNRQWTKEEDEENNRDKKRSAKHF